MTTNTRSNKRKFQNKYFGWISRHPGLTIIIISAVMIVISLLIESFIFIRYELLYKTWNVPLYIKSHYLEYLQIFFSTLVLALLLFMAPFLLLAGIASRMLSGGPDKHPLYKRNLYMISYGAIFGWLTMLITSTGKLFDLYYYLYLPLYPGVGIVTGFVVGFILINISDPY